MRILVRDNNVDQALRVLKKEMHREDVFREMKRRRFYEKPSDKATREKAAAARRARKLARKQAERDGLIAAPKKPQAQLRKAAATQARAVAQTHRNWRVIACDSISSNQMQTPA